MALNRNPSPQDNPLTQTIDFDTLLNNVALSPKESYNVTGPNFSVVPDAALNGLGTVLNKNRNGTIKLLNLDPGRYFYSIYLPQWNSSSSIHMVPSRSDPTFEDGIRDFTEGSQLDEGFSTSLGITWRTAVRSWLFFITGSSGGGSTNFSKELKFSVIGVETNKVDKTKDFIITIESPSQS